MKGRPNHEIVPDRRDRGHAQLASKVRRPPDILGTVTKPEAVRRLPLTAGDILELCQPNPCFSLERITN